MDPVAKNTSGELSEVRWYSILLSYLERAGVRDSEQIVFSKKEGPSGCIVAMSDR